MTKISTSNKSDLLIHIGIIAALFIVLFLGFFFVYLPYSTNHGQAITVPDLSRMSLDELESYLDDRELRYEVSDCTFVAGAEPLTVYGQYPKAGAKVKEGRKIYITLIKQTAPTIPMPKLTDLTFRSAELSLRSVGLEVGQKTYVPDVAKNSVLKQFFNGREVAPGTPIAKGSKIDLHIGDGLGNTIFSVPDVVGMPLDEAKALIRGSDLQIGTIISVDDPEKEVGTIVRQRPEANRGERIRVGETVDLWVVGPVEQEDTP
ncbi:PASTA domain-containing protein [Rudanella paleaurantiibacter]|uniref:PASTA domain-containing protein n=1 Tax=Rudanella paleaurantiibacter TaxID=2614655 RepID=A0A7J5TZ16_9BACT|nr:PASTA domain-containing protein [Rudanella paleaurantiibacter]KAB7730376.1 PASTA domain-containing protein [Rudanella paleaurantiibacter]